MYRPDLFHDAERRAGLRAIVASVVAALGVAAPAGEIDFSRDVRPILSENCFHCHGPDPKTREADLRLDTRKGLFADLGDHFAVVPGKPVESELVRRIASDDVDERMPPAESKLQLTPVEIETLRKWVAAGAAWEGHWSFTPPRRPPLPDFDPTSVERPDWPRNPIDRFVLARLEGEGLGPSEPATRERLLRRVTLDLTGLPPTLEQLDDFLADDSADAWARVVDRLLASRRYGERMAWDWLDAARYADSNGFQGDRERTMWPWRDWVVGALNANMPYDQFTLWQLAGDRLPEPSLEQRLATGFCRNHMINGEGGRIPEENRVEYVFDQMETAGTIWLGLTLQCCRCHDHKYDPLAQREYYQLFAFFNQTPVDGGGGDPQTKPTLDVPTADRQARIAALEGELRTLRERLAAHATERAAGQADWERRTLADADRDKWHLLAVDSATALHQKLSVLEDGSILAGGEANPANDTYTLTAPAGLQRVTVIRLEALRHETLQGGSLSQAESGNFVLTGLELHVRRGEAAERQRVKIATAEATFEQGPLKAAAALDENRSTGWAVYEGRLVDREHAALFRLAEPLDVGPTDELTITLRHDSRHVHHNLGRFRLSVTGAADARLAGEEAELLADLRTSTAERTDEQVERIDRRYRDADAASARLEAVHQKKQKQLDDVRKALPRVMVMRDLDKPRDTFLLDRGLYNKRGEKVAADVPAALPPLPADAPRDRLALARWLVDPAHPLTARVTVNREWQKFFGRGLVKTAENFGAQGERPSHPELLDWLAVELIESGWDLKALHRQIVMSATYRQSARATAALRERDPANRLLARGPRFRLPSWMIRDQALAASGLLVDRPGGPPVRPYQPAGVWSEATFGKKKYQPETGEGLYRRSLYTFWRRIVGPTMFFDAAKRQTCTVNVTRTNTPLHALATLNDVTYVEAARALAERVMQADGDLPAQIETAFRRVTSRRPTPAERDLLAGRFDKLQAHYTAAPDEALRLLAVGQSPRDEKLAPADHAALTGVCLMILNLDEALSR